MTITDERLDGALRSSLGPLAELLIDDTVREVIVDSTGGVWVERSGKALALVDKLGTTRAESVIRLLASRARVEIGPRNPLLETMLWGHIRVQGVLPPISAGATLNFRRLARARIRLRDYVTAGMMDERQCVTIEHLLRERRTVLVSGATGSGKTTLVSAMLREPAVAVDRIILIEDTAEIDMTGLTGERLLTSGTVSTRQLVRTALRMRPDRLMVGEVRGDEALDLLRALNTGHSGSICTLHANSAGDALERLLDLAREGGADVTMKTVKRAIDAVVHLERGPVVKEIRDWTGRQSILPLAS